MEYVRESGLEASLTAAVRTAVVEKASDPAARVGSLLLAEKPAAVGDAVAACFDAVRADAPDGAPFVAVQKALIGSIEGLNLADRDGASLLDVQRGVFGLLQAGAYRAHRIAYAADYHTHARDHAYPYTFSDFVAFARAVMELYKALDVVPPAGHARMDALVASLAAREAATREQIATWTEEREAEYVATQEEIRRKQAAAIAEADTAPNADAPDPAPPASAAGIASGAGGAQPSWLRKKIGQSAGTYSKAPVLSRSAAALLEGFDDVDHRGDSLFYLLTSNRVLLDHHDSLGIDHPANEARGGAVVPVAYWYEEFMPMLLEVCPLHAAPTPSH